MKTIIAANAPWPDTKAKQPPRDPIRRPRATTYLKTQPVSEIDYLREAREQLAEMKRKKNANLALPNTSTNTVDCQTNQRIRATTTRTNRGCTAMTQAEIIEVAKQAGIKRRTDEFYSEFCDGIYFDDLEAFAKLVAAKEREACAYRTGIALLGADRGLANRVDQAIRARGEA